MLNSKIYLIPGRDERLDSVLGMILIEMGHIVHGREIIGNFARLRFQEQLDIIAADLMEFWVSNAILISRSYGSYLLLHTLAQSPPFPGRILLFSPVLGGATAERYSSKPPRSEKLLELAKTGKFPASVYLEAHTGAQDNGCDPHLAESIIPSLGNARLYIVPDMGHNLEIEYMKQAVKNFISC